MTQCERYQESLNDHIDLELSDDRSAELFRHLADCSSCRNHLVALQRLRSDLRTTMDRPQHAQKIVPIRHRFAVPFPVAAVLAVTTLVSGAMLFLELNRPPEVIERKETAYVYLTPLPPVYATMEAVPVNDKKGERQ